MDDVEYDAVVSYLNHGIVPFQWSHEERNYYSLNFFVIKEVLHRTGNNLLVPRRKDMKDIILSAHIDKTGEHLEEDTTKIRLGHQYHIGNLEAEVRKFIEDCNVCLRRQLQHSKHLLVEKDQMLAKKVQDTESLLIYQRKYFESQIMIETLRNSLETAITKLLACETENQRLLQNNSLMADSMKRKHYEYSKLQGQFKTLKTSYAAKLEHGKGLSNSNCLLHQIKSIREMWQAEVNLNEQLKMQLSSKTKELLNFQNLFQKKAYDVENLRRSINILQCACTAQTEQIKSLKELIRERKRVNAMDCEEINVV